MGWPPPARRSSTWTSTRSCTGAPTPYSRSTTCPPAPSAPGQCSPSSPIIWTWRLSGAAVVRPGWRWRPGWPRSHNHARCWLILGMALPSVPNRRQRRIGVNGCHDQVRGPLAGCAAGFAVGLERLGYSRTGAREHVGLLADLSGWLAAEGLAPAELTAGQVARFLGGRARRAHPGPTTPAPGAPPLGSPA